jgi:hypothetical protein
MKTKDFIKMLQKEDPSGEGFLRINNEPILFVESKEGYWDGPYNYIERDEDDKMVWVQSTQGYKVDVMTMDMFLFAEYYSGDWEEIKKHIKINYTYVEKDKHANEIMIKLKNQCDLYNEIEKSIDNDEEWIDGISQEDWDQLTEYEKHLWLLENDYDYEKEWNNAIKRNINK